MAMKLQAARAAPGTPAVAPSVMSAMKTQPGTAPNIKMQPGAVMRPAGVKPGMNAAVMPTPNIKMQPGATPPMTTQPVDRRAAMGAAIRGNY